MERNVAENLLIELENRGYPFPGFKYCKSNSGLQLLGEGGSAVVYELYDVEQPHKKYAMKVIGFDEKRLASEEFWNSVNIQSILCSESPFVVRGVAGKELVVILDDEENLCDIRELSADNESEEGLVLQFVLMEKLDNVIVRDKFHNVNPTRDELTEETEVLKLGLQISQALLLAHKNNILHRDVKLENIFFDATENCYKLGDFGFSKLTERGNAETVIFSMGYGAPEIKRRMGDSYNLTADIYSLGISMYLLLNDMRFPGSSGYYADLVQYTPDFSFPAPQNASKPMVRLIRKMCSYWREDRHQSIEEVMMDMEAVKESLHVSDEEEDMEYADFQTLTYHEEEGEEQEESKSQKEYDKEKSRYERKEAEKKYERWYKEDIKKYFFALIVLFVLFFKGTQKDVSMVSEWQFWVLPSAVFIEAVLLRVKELHITFGIITIGLGVYSIITYGVAIPHIVLLLSVLTGTSAISATAALATAAWGLLNYKGYLDSLTLISDYRLSWIVLIVLLFTLYKVIDLRWISNKLTEQEEDIWGTVFWLLPVVMIIFGFVFRKNEAEIFSQICLIRSAIIFFLIRVWAYKEGL